jgi:two-component system NarL family sensor kinase
MLELHQVGGVIREMRAEIELSQPQFGELTNLSGASSLVIDNKGAISRINDTAAIMLGFNVEELLGALLMPLAADGESPLICLLLEGTKPKRFQTFEVVLHGRSGRKSPVIAVPVPIDHDDCVTRSILLMLTEEARRHVSTPVLRSSDQKLQHFARPLIVAHEVDLQNVSSQLHDDIAQVLAVIKYRSKTPRDGLSRARRKWGRTFSMRPCCARVTRWTK